LSLNFKENIYGIYIHISSLAHPAYSALIYYYLML